jgi:hypothetical protein
MTIIWAVVLIVGGQAVHYFIFDTVHMDEVIVILGEILPPPPHLSIRRMWLCLEVFKALMVILSVSA